MEKFRAFASLFFLCIGPWTISFLRADQKDIAHPKTQQQDNNTIWPLNVVPYTISKTIAGNDVRLIRKAMDDLTNKTSNCVSFVQRTNESDFVRFTHGSGCWSNVGRQGGHQTISLAKGCLEELSDIQRQLMHVLGFPNEINRPDRDQFVTINWDNIKDKQAFKIWNGPTYGLPYDFDSIMQPSSSTFVNPNVSTIIPKGTTRVMSGKNKSLSVLDIQRIRIRYRCVV